MHRGEYFASLQSSEGCYTYLDLIHFKWGSETFETPLALQIVAQLKPQHLKVVGVMAMVRNSVGAGQWASICFSTIFLWSLVS